MALLTRPAHPRHRRAPRASASPRSGASWPRAPALSRSTGTRRRSRRWRKLWRMAAFMSPRLTSPTAHPLPLPSPRAANVLGGLDGVVNAAGIDLIADLEAMTLAEWSRVLAVNLTGPMLVMQAACPHLRAAGGGTIVNVSSGAGLSPLKHRTAYCASKAGLQMSSKAVAMEAAEFGIRVNTVCPGAVETELFRSSIDHAPDPQAAYEAVRARYALQRIASPDEIAAAILWLTSAESSYVTGTAIAVDGGRTFH